MEIKIIGYFGVDELCPDPILDEGFEPYRKNINLDKIYKINNGIPLYCGKKISDFVNIHHKHKDNYLLYDTHLLERAVQHFRPNVNGKTIIFSRTAVLTSMVSPILNGRPSKVHFRFQDNKLSLFDPRLGSTDGGFGVGVEQMLTSEEDISAEQVLLHGYWPAYQVTQLTSSKFVIFNSKEIDCFDNSNNVVEVKSSRHRRNIHLDNLLLKNVAFSNIRKIAVADLAEEGNDREIASVRKVIIVDDLRKMDNSNLVNRAYDILDDVMTQILPITQKLSQGYMRITKESIEFFDPPKKASRRLQNFPIQTVWLAIHDLQNNELVRQGYGSSSGSSIENVPLDALYLVENSYFFKNSWPMRDLQSTENFLNEEHDVRGKPVIIYYFTYATKRDPEVERTLSERGYSYDKEASKQVSIEQESVFCWKV